MSTADISDASADISKSVLLTPTQINLVEMAALADISATSYAISVSGECQPKICCFALEDNFSVNFNLERKTYCALYINKFRTIACVDNGSDLTVMQKSLFTNLFMYTHRRILEPCILKSITSFSANPIKVIGQFTCLVSFTISGPKVPITITVISDIIGVPNMLLGNDSLRATWAVLAFAGDKNDPQPELIVRNPIDQKVVVYYESPRNIFTCEALVALKPFETKTVDFDLNHAAPVLCNTEIIINSIDWGKIQVYPSKSDLYFNHQKDKFTATGLVVNLTNECVIQTIVAKFEISILGQIKRSLSSKKIGKNYLA